VKYRHQTYIAPPLLCSQACSLAIVRILLRLLFESYNRIISYQFIVHFIPLLQQSLTILEGFGYVIVAEATQAERPGDFTVLLGDRLARREQRAERVETNEEVLFGHYVIGVGWEKMSGYGEGVKLHTPLKELFVLLVVHDRGSTRTLWNRIYLPLTIYKE